MSQIIVGSEVVRVSGAAYQVGIRGTVVEVSAQRLRVLWRHRNGTPDKRTWVQPKVVRLAAAQGADCQGCYADPCECLPNNHPCDPE